MKKIALLLILGIIIMSSCNQSNPESKTESKVSDTTASDSKNDTVRSLSRYEIDDPILDYDSVYTDEEKKSLIKLLKDYESKTTNEIVIITIPNLDTFKNIDDLSLRYFNDLGIGKKDKNNGLGMIFCKSCKRVRIQTGKGTEKILTDKICIDIIEKIMNPFFVEGKYTEGIEKGFKEIIRIWDEKG